MRVSRLGVAVLACLILGASSRGWAQDSTQWQSQLTGVEGNVTLYPADGSPAVQAQIGMPLDQGDRITTGDNSSAEIGLDGLHVISLEADSDFTLQSAERASTIFSLALGTLIAKIHHLLIGQDMEVRSPEAVAAVRGTEFGVDVSPSGQTDVGVFDEGRVSVESSAGGPPEFLTPNQETSVLRGRRPAAVHALRRFLRSRRIMRRLRRRIALIRRRWKRLPPAARRALRRRFMQRLRTRRGSSRGRRSIRQRNTRRRLRRRARPNNRPGRRFNP